MSYWIISKTSTGLWNLHSMSKKMLFGVRWLNFQLRKGLVSDAIESFIRADDATQFLDVIRAVEDADVYQDLVRYLLMVRQKAKEPKVDSELIYAYAKIDRLGDIEEFILMPNVANLPSVGDRLYDEALYEAAKIIFAFISNWAKLAITLVKLKQFQGAVDAARKANSSKTWKKVSFDVDPYLFTNSIIILLHICSKNLVSFDLQLLAISSNTLQPKGGGGEIPERWLSGCGGSLATLKRVRALMKTRSPNLVQKSDEERLKIGGENSDEREACWEKGMRQSSEQNGEPVGANFFGLTQ
ncbi:unnamed protein product [Ilex paraguariensis]|uniref:Uncharacterized protein n=1 Tax=Ilex paraguariensis TaxID=185542 RepID=A0ABC8T5P8_9AQUA